MILLFSADPASRRALPILAAASHPFLLQWLGEAALNFPLLRGKGAMAWTNDEQLEQTDDLLHSCKVPSLQRSQALHRLFKPCNMLAEKIRLKGASSILYIKPFIQIKWIIIMCPWPSMTPAFLRDNETVNPGGRLPRLMSAEEWTFSIADSWL